MANSLITAKSAADRTQVLECKISPAGGGLITLDTEHSLIHAGEMYQLSGQIPSIAAGATAYLHGLTPATGQVHFRAASVVVDGAPVDIAFYEDADITANGSGLTAYNKNRQSTNTPDLQVFSGPTIGGGGAGTTLETGFIPTIGPGSNHGGLSDLFASEWILDQSTSYLVSITNNNGAAIKVNYNFLWYEV